MQFKVHLCGVLRGNPSSVMQGVHQQCCNSHSATFCMGCLIWNKKSFFHFYSDSFQKGRIELKKTTFIPSTYKELHRTTWCRFALTLKALLLAPVLTPTWKGWGSPTTGSLQVRLHDLAFERHFNPLSFPSTAYGYTLIIMGIWKDS